MATFLISSLKMRKFKSTTKNIGYFFYRVLEPVFDPIKFFNGLGGYLWFIRDFVLFNKLYKDGLRFTDIFPQLHDKVSLTPFDAHYYHQQLWVFENVYSHKPTKHVDIASTYEMSGYLSKIVPTDFVDIRPFKVDLKNLTIIDGSILALPYADASLESISCLHVIEHIGLGRYGDPIDPDALRKACLELSRVVAVGGILYLSTPIGKKNVYFNAHRVSDPDYILSLFPNYELLTFLAVDDNGTLVSNSLPHDYINSNYALGMYKLRRKQI